MGKKKSGTTYTSKGERPTVTKQFRGNGIPNYKQSFERLQNVQDAYNKGKPISNDTLLKYGPRNSSETAKYNELRKANA